MHVSKAGLAWLKWWVWAVGEKNRRVLCAYPTSCCLCSKLSCCLLPHCLSCLVLSLSSCCSWLSWCCLSCSPALGLLSSIAKKYKRGHDVGEARLWRMHTIYMCYSWLPPSPVPPALSFSLSWLVPRQKRGGGAGYNMKKLWPEGKKKKKWSDEGDYSSVLRSIDGHAVHVIFTVSCYCYQLEVCYYFARFIVSFSPSEAPDWTVS